MRFLLVTFLRKPGGQIDEEVRLAKRVKPADVSTCNIIVDYALKKVEKCNIEGKRLDTDFDRLNEYYKSVYPPLIAQLEREASISLKAKDDQKP
jgi:hypothetical protein